MPQESRTPQGTRDQFRGQPCRMCANGRNCVNGRYCVALGEYVEHQPIHNCINYDKDG